MEVAWQTPAAPRVEIRLGEAGVVSVLTALATRRWLGTTSAVAVAGLFWSLVAIALVTLVHGYLTYSTTIYTMHEGAGHGLLVMGRSGAARRPDGRAAGRVLGAARRALAGWAPSRASRGSGMHCSISTARSRALPPCGRPARPFDHCAPKTGSSKRVYKYTSRHMYTCLPVYLSI